MVPWRERSRESIVSDWQERYDRSLRQQREQIERADAERSDLERSLDRFGCLVDVMPWPVGVVLVIPLVYRGLRKRWNRARN